MTVKFNNIFDPMLDPTGLNMLYGSNLQFALSFHLAYLDNIDFYFDELDKLIALKHDEKMSHQLRKLLTAFECVGLTKFKILIQIIRNTYRKGEHDRSSYYSLFLRILELELRPIVVLQTRRLKLILNN